MAFPGLIRDCKAVAARSAVADIFSLQSSGLHRLPASAFARITFASLTGAVLPASAKNSRSLLNGQKMHRRKAGPAITLTRLLGDEVTFAVILAIADIIFLAGFGSNDRT